MDARELKIGNLILIGGNTIDTYQTYKPKTVTIEILADILKENNERPETKTEPCLSIYQPLPLTQKLLDEFQFYILEYGCLIEIDIETHLRIIESSGEFYPQLEQVVESINDPYMIVTLKSIKYAHQLQNIYSDLKGDELQIISEK